jgi:DNA-directed RNA polymerase I, II, and III subunit RPABC2
MATITKNTKAKAAAAEAAAAIVKPPEIIESDAEESDIDVESDAEEEEAEEEEDVAAEEEESDVEESEEEESEAEESGAEAEEEESGAEAEEEDESLEPKEKKKTKGKRTGKKIVSQIEGIEKLEASKKSHMTQYDSDENEEDETNYLQKFDSKMRENFIADHHPEARTHNYEEVKALTRVSRDGRGIIIDPLHKTIPFLTKYEMTRVIGQRAKQLDNGAKAFVKVPLNVVDGYPIALLELEQKKLPFIIKRPYPNGGVEYWNVSDLEVLL